MGNTKFYVDDGYTGTNFNRPGFQELLDDIEMGYVGTIIVKDMSRFGREYLQVGYYTENYFPDHNIRFNAINDNVDCVDGTTDMDDFIPIKNIMNELYAKDISRKVRSAHNTRGRAGEPLSHPPYGYVKYPQDKKSWIIDPEAASVVREIFKLYLDGNGEDTIARIMQEEQHLNCTAYWASKGINRGGKKSQPNPYKWKSSTILKLRRKLTEMGEKENEREEFIHAIRKFMEMRTLTKQVLNELIDHIDVYETQGTGKNKTQRLVIYYKFVGYLDIDPTQCHPNYTADIREGVAIEYVSCEPTDSLKELFPEGYGACDDSFEEAKPEQA